MMVGLSGSGIDGERQSLALHIHCQRVTVCMSMAVRKETKYDAPQGVSKSGI